VADAAYPAQHGIEVLVSGEEHESVLREVSKLLKDAGHVRPVAMLDQEFDAVTGFELLPDLRVAIDEALEGIEVERLWHDELISILRDVAGQFRVIVIKTQSAIPYSSVFFKLECGYWTEDQEKELRRRLS
jgi:hypothetical protein